MIRDHFSGLFYAEITNTENIFSVFKFLYRAWSKKKFHPLYGIPLGVTIPKTVHSLWPNLPSFLEDMGISTINVTSGFQGGIRDIRTWEESLRCGIYESGYPPNYKEVLKHVPYACSNLNTSNYKGKPKSTIWIEGLQDEVHVPASEKSFDV